MAQIHELSDILANQIAAGEVIERPASVVKELVENAIDAHSTRIDILLEESGLKLIKVIDNGDGIAKSEVNLAFKRHATSKINNRQDLFKIKTLGFRGEALPSIASIAQVELTTAQANQVGAYIKIKGGQVLVEKPAQSRQGTIVSVSELFYNTPARLKYLNSLVSEMAAVSDVVNRLALSHADIAFSLTHNGKQLLQTVGNGNLLQTFSAIYGVQNAKEMLAFNGQDLDFKISGFVSLPKLTRASKNYITLLLNGRSIKNFKLTKAIIQGYSSKLMIGRYPFAVISIELDPLLVDVNVHPAKQEVRISKEQQLCDLLTQLIQQRLAQENLIQDGYANLKQKKQVKKTTQLDLRLGEADPTYPTKKEQRTLPKKVEQVLLGQPPAEIKSPPKVPRPLIIEHKAQLTSVAMQQWDTKYQLSHSQDSNEQLAPSKKVTEAGFESKKTELTEHKVQFPALAYLGQLHGTYLLAQGEQGLYIIDQHAAQERIKFEYYREKIAEYGQAKQKLLLPIILSYSVSDALKISENLAKLAQLGIELEDFGQNTFIIREHPQWFNAGQEEEIIREIIDYCLKDPTLTVAKFRQKTAIMMSCKKSIKANHHLDEKQAKSLLKQLSQCSNPFNCPHGRPVIVSLSNKDLEHMFKRIQDSHQSNLDLEE